VADAVGNLYLCMAACTVGLAITVAMKLVSNWHANGSSKEDSMETKQAHRKVVRSSILSTIEAVGTTTIGGLLAA
jgi:hypothetical protein